MLLVFVPSFFVPSFFGSVVVFCFNQHVLFCVFWCGLKKMGLLRALSAGVSLEYEPVRSA